MKKSGVLQAYRSPLFTPNAVGEGVSSISRWKIVNQVGKHDFPCVQIFLVNR